MQLRVQRVCSYIEGAPRPAYQGLCRTPAITDAVPVASLRDAACRNAGGWNPLVDGLQCPCCFRHRVRLLQPNLVRHYAKIGIVVELIRLRIEQQKTAGTHHARVSGLYRTSAPLDAAPVASLRDAASCNRNVASCAHGGGVESPQPVAEAFPECIGEEIRWLAPEGGVVEDIENIVGDAEIGSELTQEGLHNVGEVVEQFVGFVVALVHRTMERHAKRIVCKRCEENLVGNRPQNV